MASLLISSVNKRYIVFNNAFYCTSSGNTKNAMRCGAVERVNIKKPFSAKLLFVIAIH